MTLKELQNAVHQLSAQEQIMLLETLTDAIEHNQSQAVDRRAMVERLRGCLKGSGKRTLSDSDVERLREERLTEKYLQ